MIDPNETITETVRRAIFAAVVDAQDGGATVPASRSAAGARFGVTSADIVRIEREGLDSQWPPLDGRD